MTPSTCQFPIFRATVSLHLRSHSLLFSFSLPPPSFPIPLLCLSLSPSAVFLARFSCSLKLVPSSPSDDAFYHSLSRRLNYFISPVFLRYPRRWPFKSRHNMVSMIEPYGKVEKLSDVQGSFSSLNTTVMKFILMFSVDLRYRYPFAYTMDYKMAVKINCRTSQLSDERLLFKMSLVRC